MSNLDGPCIRYHDEYHSIMPMGDISDLVPADLADVCVLEEPEHLSWFKAPFKGKDWTAKFRYVVGIIHTNYQIYIKQNHWMAAPFIFVANQSNGTEPNLT